jgi:hypothetical protein
MEERRRRSVPNRMSSTLQSRHDRPRFWLAALASLGEDVDLRADLPDYYAGTSV